MKKLFKTAGVVKVPPSPPAGDAAFLRRVTLDLNREQPTPRGSQAPRPTSTEKGRARDELLANADFVRSGRSSWATMLQIVEPDRQRLAYKSPGWLTEQN